MNRARPYVFSTASPAAAAAAALAALDIVRDEPHAASNCSTVPRSCAASLLVQGWNIGPSASQIIPLVVGEAERAMTLSAGLRERGLLVPAIRPPTVPEGEACLRISLTAGHTEEMISAFLAALACKLSEARQKP